VTEPLDILRQIGATLREGGVLFVGVPRLDTLAQHGDFKYCLDGRRHLMCLSQTCLTGLLARAGFGVTTVLEGSVRRSGSRLRVTAQLITAADGTHVWSQRYDRELADVFDVQDEIAQAIAAALKVKLALRAAVHTPQLAAYEELLRGRYHLFKFTSDSWQRAKACVFPTAALRW